LLIAGKASPETVGKQNLVVVESDEIVKKAINCPKPRLSTFGRLSQWQATQMSDLSFAITTLAWRYASLFEAIQATLRMRSRSIAS
jgi:hypothetical protein